LRCRKAADRLINWYWSIGYKRQGPEIIGSGTWLSKAYSVSKQLSKIAAQPEVNRKTMALWGPSQAGKSTLLSGFIDRPVGQFNSALQWSSSRGVMFVGADQRTGLRLNPHNLGGDASGCVTRFSLSEQIDFEDFPVEFIFADPDQLLEAVAIGYMTECDQEAGFVVWEPDLILRLLEAVPVAGGVIDKHSYDLLHDFTLAIDDLILARWPRYRNLSDRWQQIKAAILESQALLTSSENTSKFIARILWDGQDRLTEFYLYLLKHLKQYPRSGRFFATHQLTSRILDITSSENITQGEVEEFCVQESGNNIFFGTNEGKSIANNRLQFAIFQALVWEIRVPINARVLRASAPEVADALAQVDILDFPGVAQQGAGGSKKKIKDFEQLELFTKVLKRGKTASVVVSYARTLGIDGFSLLIRMQNPIPHPDQLIAGLTAWCHQLGLEWPPTSTPPPLNIVLTFSSKLINIVAQTGHDEKIPEKLGKVFEWFESIRPIADHRWAKFWATSYPQFAAGGEGVVSASIEGALGAVETIMSNGEFRQRFAHDPEGLMRMTTASMSPEGDGAVGHFLNSIPTMLASSNLHARRGAFVLEAFEELQALAQEALPIDVTGSDTRKDEIASWQKDIDEQLRECQRQNPELDAAATVAAAILAVTEVDPDALAPLPVHAETRDLSAFIADQVKVRWFEIARRKMGELSLAGINTQTLASRRLSYLCDELVEGAAFSDWIKGHLGQLEHPEECRQARRFLALKMSDILLYGPGKAARAHRSHVTSEDGSSEVNLLLNQYANYEISPGAKRLPVQSPHYAGVLKPFFENLSYLARQSSRARSTQPGDKEMAILINEEGL
jgi:hypothetical protein